jgi:hypothetical protein
LDVPSRPGAAADLLPSNDPLPICCGCPETYITGIIFDGRRTKMGSIGVWRVCAGWLTHSIPMHQPVNTTA